MTDQTQLSAKIAEYRKLLAQDRKSLVFVPLAECYLRSGMLDDALEVALKGTWELPDYAPGYLAVGRVYTQRQVMKKALAAYQKAIEVDPSCLDAYKSMARLYREQGDNDAAANLLTKAVFIFPEEPSLKQMLESLTSSAPAAPSQPVQPAPVKKEEGLKPITTATIAQIYIEQGLYDKALEVYRELYAETGAPEVAQKIAEIESLARGGAVAAAAPVVEQPVPVVKPAVAAGPSGQPSGSTVLETLNNMLATIQSRRNRV